MKRYFPSKDLIFNRCLVSTTVPITEDIAVNKIDSNLHVLMGFKFT